MELPDGPLPTINSNQQDILLDGQPQFDPSTAHAYANSDWATCVKTRRSFGGSCIRLAGGTIAYKCKFQPTVAGSSTKAKFMAAYDTGKMILLYAAFSGIFTFHRKQSRYASKTTMDVQQWVTLKSQPLEHDTSISNIFPLPNGLNATS